MQTSLFLETARYLAPELRLDIERVIFQFRHGIHRSAMSGTGIEFRGLKPYEASDPLTRIDYFSSERLSEEPDLEPLVRSFHPEREISVFFISSVEESMGTPPKKMEHVSALLWLFALSAFKPRDRFRIVLFSGVELYDSRWLTNRERMEEFFRHSSGRRETMSKTAPGGSIFSWLETLVLHDALVVFVSDFAEAWWDEEPRIIWRLNTPENNSKIILLALDEWSDFVPTGFGMDMQDPRTGKVRYFSEKELLALKEASATRLRNIQERVRPLSVPFIRIPLLGDPIQTVRKEWLRYGFE